jgi:hypothetical protein
MLARNFSKQIRWRDFCHCGGVPLPPYSEFFLGIKFAGVAGDNLLDYSGVVRSGVVARQNAVARRPAGSLDCSNGE